MYVAEASVPLAGATSLKPKAEGQVSNTIMSVNVMIGIKTIHMTSMKMSAAKLIVINASADWHVEDGAEVNSSCTEMLAAKMGVM